MNTRKFGLLGAGVAATLAIAELVRSLLTRHALVGWSTGLTWIGSVAFVGALGVTAVGLLLPRSFGWGVGVLGVIVALGFGVMITAGGSGHTHAMWGGLYLAGAVALLACLAKSLAYYRRSAFAVTHA